MTGDTDDLLSLCFNVEAFEAFEGVAVLDELLLSTEDTGRWSCLTLILGYFSQKDVRESIVKSQQPIKSSTSSSFGGLNNSRAPLVSKVPLILNSTNFLTCERCSKHFSVRRVLLSDKWLNSSNSSSTLIAGSVTRVLSKFRLFKCFRCCNAANEGNSSSLPLWWIKPDSKTALVQSLN